MLRKPQNDSARVDRWLTSRDLIFLAWGTAVIVLSTTIAVFVAHWFCPPSNGVTVMPLVEVKPWS